MQIIQGIRDKGAAIVIVVIALSLIGFILMDAKQGTSKLFSSGSSVIGKVNGNPIEQAEFNKKVQQTEEQQEQQSGKKTTVAGSAQVRDQVWNQMVAEKVFYAEADKLGIDFTSKELSAVLSSNDPSNPLMQEQGMIDSTTGKLNEAKAREALATIKKSKGEQFDMINTRIVEPQKINSISTKYMALLNASAYYPSWMEEKDKKENKSFANIAYVAIPFNVISDSTLKVSDEEIGKYLQSHKGLFKQEEGRQLSYVSFSQLPSADDSSRIRDVVAALKSDFSTTQNVKTFVARNTSVIEYDSNFLPKSKLKVSAPGIMDSIARLPIGSVIGPYVDKDNYVLAKMLGTKTLPDSVKAKHILIATVNSQTGQPIMADSIAKKQADSIYAAINAGADFTALAKQYSADGSKDKGGDLGTFGYGVMVPEFNNFCFNKSAGSRGVVKTQYGYHIIEIVNQKGSSTAYKIAFMAKEILASEATINKASLDATKLSAEKESKNFEAYLQKNALKKISLPTLIKENDAAVGQLQEARQLVRWVFDAKKGDVSDPISIGDQFIVAVVDKIQEEGTQDIQTARKMAEPAVRDEKKGVQILKKLGNNPTLETAATAFGKEVLTAGADSSITFRATIINNIGDEPKLVGAVFNKENQTKVSAPIIGKTGIFLLKVNSFGNKAEDSPEKATQKRTQQITEIRNQAMGGWFEGLKKQATIKDNRSKFF